MHIGVDGICKFHIFSKDSKFYAHRFWFGYTCFYNFKGTTTTTSLSPTPINTRMLLGNSRCSHTTNSARNKIWIPLIQCNRFHTYYYLIVITSLICPWFMHNKCASSQVWNLFEVQWIFVPLEGSCQLLFLVPLLHLLQILDLLIIFAYAIDTPAPMYNRTLYMQLKI